MDEHSQQNIKYGKAFDPAVDGFFHNISLPASHFGPISQSYAQVIMVHFRLLLLLSAYRRHENYKGKHTQNFRRAQPSPIVPRQPTIRLSDTGCATAPRKRKLRDRRP